MILIRNITTGESFGIFDNANEIKEEYPLNPGEYKRLRELSSHNRPYIIKRFDNDLLMALYIPEALALEKNLIIC